MKVLLVNGSPHQKGCTYTALEEVARALQKDGIETEIFWIQNKPIGGCIACKKCDQLHKCVFDDVVNVFIEKAREADGFVFGSPVHYAAASGNMTAFMDRAFYAGSRAEGPSLFYFKPAAAISSARRAGTTATFDQLNKYMTIAQMPIVSSRYWNMVHGANPDEVRQDEEGMQCMRILGTNMAYMLKAFEFARKEGLEPPTPEVATFTNFIR